MKQTLVYNICLLGLVLLSCKSGLDSSESNALEVVPEATLNIYCNMNENLTDDEKLSFCQYNSKGSQFWVQVAFRVGSAGIDSLDVTLFEVTDNNYAVIEHEAVIDSVFNVRRLNKIEGLIIQNEDSYIFRLRPEMFCQGYGEVFDLGSGAARKAMEGQVKRPE